MKFILSSHTTYPIENIIKWSILAEKYNFDYFSLTDWAPTTYNDAFVTLANIATVTKKIGVGITICNPYSRHPAMIARMIKTLYTLSDGRIFIGIGAGGAPALLPLGYKMWEKPIATVRDAVKVIRCLLKGEKVNMQSYMFEVSDLCFDENAITVPIYIGARRPQMLRLAGRIADGVILGSCPPEIVQWSKKHIQRGLAKSHRDISDFHIADWIASSISEDGEKARKFIKPRVAIAIYHQPMETLKETWHDLEIISQIKSKVSENKVDEATEFVTDEMIDAFSLTGTPEEIGERIRKLASSGVTHIMFGTPLGENVEKSIEMIGTQVIPALRD